MPVSLHRAMDPLLSSFLYAADDKQAQWQLEQLLQQHAEPILHSAHRRQYGNVLQEAADIRSDVLVVLMERLRLLRAHHALAQDFGRVATINNFHAYTKVIVRRTWSSIRCERQRSRALSLTDLTKDADDKATIDIADTRLDVPALIANRDLLRRSWREILRLPAAQRIVLLMNLRDGGTGGDGLSLLLYLRITTHQEIAAALHLTLDEFADLLPKLPLDDNTIAGHLGITRREVISIRQATRRRLEHKLRI